MSNANREELRSTLRWLIEAGADEAIAETPINRLHATIPSPLEGEGGAPREAALAGRVGGESADTSPLPEARMRASTPDQVGGRLLPQREGRNTPQAAGRQERAAEAVSLSTAPGAARALAGSCATLA